MRAVLWIMCGAVLGVAALVGLPRAEAEPTDAQLRGLSTRIANLEKIGATAKFSALDARLDALDKLVTKMAPPFSVDAQDALKDCASKISALTTRVESLEAALSKAKPDTITAAGLLIVDDKGMPVVRLDRFGLSFSERAFVHFAQGGQIDIRGMVGDGVSGPMGELGGKTRTWILPGTVGLYGVRGERLAWLTTADGYHPTLVLQNHGRGTELQVDVLDEELRVRLNGEAIALPPAKKRVPAPDVEAPEQPK